MRSTLTLVLFFILISCNKSIDTGTKKQDENITNLSSYLSKQLLLQSQTQEIFQREADFNMLYSKIHTVTSDKELKTALLESKIERVDLLIELFKQQDLNLKNFIQNDESGFFDRTNEEKQASINSALDSLFVLEYTDRSMQMNPSTCLQTYNTAINRCRRDYAIVGLTSLASIPLTFGAGLFGWGISSLQLYFCESDARDDYNKCKD